MFTHIRHLTFYFTISGGDVQPLIKVTFYVSHTRRMRLETKTHLHLDVFSLLLFAIIMKGNCNFSLLFLSEGREQDQRGEAAAVSG